MPANRWRSDLRGPSQPGSRRWINHRCAPVFQREGEASMSGYTPWQTTGPAARVDENTGSRAKLPATRHNQLATIETNMKNKITRTLLSATLMSLLVDLPAPAQTLKPGGPPVAPYAAPIQPLPSQPMPSNPVPALANPIAPRIIPGLPVGPKPVQPKIALALPVPPDPLHPGKSPKSPAPLTPIPPPSVRGQPEPPILPTATNGPAAAIKPLGSNQSLLVLPPAPTELRVMAASQP